MLAFTPGPQGTASEAAGEGFAKDLEIVLRTIREQHPAYDSTPALRSAWDKQTASLRFRLDALSAADFARELARLVALLEDPKTRILREAPAARDSAKALMRDANAQQPYFATRFAAVHYLRLRDLSVREDESFVPWCETALGSIPPEVRRLVLDLRACKAVSRRAREGLLTHMRSTSFDAAGKLFVVTDARTTAAALETARVLRREASARIVRDDSRRTGDSRFDRASTTRLPASELTLRCSTRRTPEDEGDESTKRRTRLEPAAIEPDSVARRRAEDVDDRGRDLALELIAAWRPEAARRAASKSLHEAPTPSGRESYLGRRIARTMHWRGAAWLMRRTRENEEHTARLLEALALKPGLDICDFGCGNGYHAIPIAKRIGGTGRVFAVDIQKQMLSMLRQRQKRAGVSNVVCVHNSATSTGLAPRSCDLILMVDVYHELSHPVITLAGLRRALKPGGRLVLVEFRAEDPEVPIKKLHKMSKAQVRKELEANGFRLHTSFDGLPWQHVLSFVARS